MNNFSNLKGDIRGGITAAAVSIPQCLGYGLIAFSALGTEFASKSAVMGIYAAIFAGLIASFLGGNSIQITGPKAPVTIILASAISALMVKPEVLAVPLADRQVIILGLAATMVFWGGLFQVIFGWLRFGSIIKYIPYPVICGFMNGIAFILIESQIKMILGVSNKASYVEIMAHPAKIKILTLIVGLATLGFIPLARRFLKAIPPPLAALVGGSLLFHIIASFIGASSLGLEVGPIGGRWPRPDALINLLGIRGREMVLIFLPHLVSTALILGLIGSMDTLLSSAATDNVTGFRHDCNRELVGQGLGNMTSSLFGAIFSCGSVPRSLVNFEAGGRTMCSGIISSLALFLVVTVFPVLVENIPLCVLGGIIIYIGIMLIDSWTINLVKSIATALTKDNISLTPYKDIAIDFLVIIVVTAITAIANIALAVGVGVFIAGVMFILTTRNSITKRIYCTAKVHSKKVRKMNDTKLLEQHGKQIIVFELSGPLFFGSAETLAKEIDNFPDDFTYCILDMKWLTNIDSTGANIILQIHKGMARERKCLLISHAINNPSLGRFLDLIQVSEMGREEQFFLDTDAALEWAEDHLLSNVREAQATNVEVPLEQMPITAETAPSHMQGLRLETKPFVDWIPLPAHLPSSLSRRQRYSALQGEYGPYCDQCQLIHGEEHRFCQRCGQLLKNSCRPAGRGCARCGSSTFQGQKFCYECGLPLRTPTKIPSLVGILILLVGGWCVWRYISTPSSSAWIPITTAATQKVEKVTETFLRQLHNFRLRCWLTLNQKLFRNAQLQDYYVAVEHLKLRERPTNKSRIVEVLPYKSKLKVLDENSDGWFQVLNPKTNLTAWAPKEDLKEVVLEGHHPSTRLKREPKMGIKEIKPSRKNKGNQEDMVPQSLSPLPFVV